LSISQRIDLVLLVAVALAGCGDKVPESSAAKKVGEQPKQIVDKVTTDVTKAMQKEGQQPEAEKKE
jgi:PBP1b-binding outer membrane lipoprotein LpoB